MTFVSNAKPRAARGADGPAAPHNILTPPYGWRLFFVVPQQIAVRAWVVEQDRKQRRHERLSFIVELAILVFVFVETCISIYDLFDKVAPLSAWADIQAEGTAD
jgi:hypothetical protein